MKKLVMVILAMTISTQVFAMARKPALPSRTEAMNAACAQYGNPYGSGWNPRYQVDTMNPMISDTSGNHKALNYLRDEDGDFIPNPLYNPSKPTYDPAGFSACRDAYLASH